MKIGFTCSTFDLLHAGHVQMLRDAKEQCDYLICGLQVDEFVHVIGDAHLYNNHFDQAREQISRKPGGLPQLLIHRTPESIDGFRFDDFEITGYDAQPHIAAPIAV